MSTFQFNSSRVVVAGLLLLVTVGSIHATTVLHYRFETANGSPVVPGAVIGTVDDSSGNERIGSVIGAPNFAPTPFADLNPSIGVNTYAAFFNGGYGSFPSQAFLISAIPGPIINSSFTVEAFFRMMSFDPNTGDVKTLFRVRDSSLEHYPFGLNILNLNGHGGTDDLLYQLQDDTAGVAAYDLELNRDYFVAVTYDGVQASLYLDHTLVGSTYFPGFTGSAAIDGVLGGTFQGFIDEFRVSDSALMPSQFLNADPVPEGGSTALAAALAISLCCCGGIWRRRVTG